MSPRRVLGDLEASIGKARAEADWITESDESAVYLLRKLAYTIDQGGLEPRELADLTGRTLALLRELGLTPASRHGLGLWEEGDDDGLGAILGIVPASTRDSKK